MERDIVEEIEEPPSGYSSVVVDKERFIQLLTELDKEQEIAPLRDRVSAVRRIIASPDESSRHLLPEGANGKAVSLRRDVLVSELDQIAEAHTIDRAKYYLRRLERGIERVKTSKINDINLLRWKEYEGVLTDSLWMLDRRDTSGAHLGWYWGNFVPQIPRQLMMRYTKKGDWVLDTFAGSGTTLIECRRMGRNGIGIELNAGVAARARETVDREINLHSVRTEIIRGDARNTDAGSALEGYGAKQVQLVVMHPPYHDIIRFSKDRKDLSGAKSTDAFLRMFGEVVDNASPLLEKGRYLALIIGDKYSGGDWIPLGFYSMSQVLERGFSLKSIIVKNFDETRAKRDQKQLWRYRALAGGFYIFKHEYIFIFKKK
ncbi:MAG TPA: DNA methyltransferase [Blastocatellia bacterium]|nr:DNA methyltransferase [Blastocatellia bacterium]